MISQSTIDKVRSLPIEQVIGSYIDLKKEGTNLKAISPFAEEKTPSFSVSQSKNIFKCFSTNKSGDGISFVMEYENSSYPEAIESICKSQDITVEYEQNWTNEQKEAYRKANEEKKTIELALNFALNYFQQQEIPKQFLKERGISKSVIERFQLGYAPKKGFAEVAIKAQYSKEVLIKAGLIRESNKVLYDVFQERLMFPIFDYSGRIVAFSGRLIKEKTDEDKNYIKYFNTPSSAWVKGDHFFGLHQAITSINKMKSPFFYLVEGYTDVTTMSRKGMKNTISSNGTAFTENQLKLISRYTSSVVIVPDFDIEKENNPGLLACHSTAQQLIKNGFNVAVLLPAKEGQMTNSDPDSFVKKLVGDDLINWKKGVREYVADFLYNECYELAKTSIPEKVAQIKRLSNVMNTIPDQVTRNLVYDEISTGWNQFKKNAKVKKDSEKTLSQLAQKQKELNIEYRIHKFEEKDSQMWVKNKDNEDVSISNFVINIPYAIQSVDNPTYVCQLTNTKGRTVYCSFPIKSFATKQAFKLSCEEKIEYFFFGEEKDLNYIKIKKVGEAKVAMETDQLGQYGDMYIWANGIYFQKYFFESNKYGVVNIKHKIKSIEEFKTLPPSSILEIKGAEYKVFSAIDFYEQYQITEEQIIDLIKEENVLFNSFNFLPFSQKSNFSFGGGEQEDQFSTQRRSKLAPKTELNFTQWATLIKEVYFDHAYTVVPYYIMAVFRDVIYKANSNWNPLLYLYGPPEQGKSTLCHSLCSMFGEPLPDGLNYSGGSSVAGISRYLNSISNGLPWLNELNDDLPNHKVEMLKKLADGGADLKGKNTGGNETKTYQTRSATLLSGQELINKPALIQRCFVTYVDAEKRNPKKFEELKSYESKLSGTRITCELLQYRELIQQNYKKVASKMKTFVKNQYEKKFDTPISSDRSVLNLVSILTPIYIIERNNKGFLPFNFKEMVDVLLTNLKSQIATQDATNDIDSFIQILAGTTGSTENDLMHENHFKIEEVNGKQYLYLRLKMSYAYYKRACQKAPLPERTITKYFENHRWYLGKAKKYFKESSLKDKTTCIKLDYDAIVDSEIEFRVAADVDVERGNRLEAEEQRLLEANKKKVEQKEMF